jgi:hypothetical protein
VLIRSNTRYIDVRVHRGSGWVGCICSGAMRQRRPEMEVIPARPLKVGIVLPQIEGMLAGGTARWSDLLSITQTAEAVGFDSVWLVGHFLFPPRQPDGPALGWWECGHY